MIPMISDAEIHAGASAIIRYLQSETGLAAEPSELILDIARGISYRVLASARKVIKEKVEREGEVTDEAVAAALECAGPEFICIPMTTPEDTTKIRFARMKQVLEAARKGQYV